MPRTIRRTPPPRPAAIGRNRILNQGDLDEAMPALSSGHQTPRRREHVQVENPFLTRKLLPGYAAIMHKRYGGPDSTEIISDMRDGR